MLRSLSYWSCLFLLTLIPLLVQGQEMDDDSLIQQVNTVENPLYKPVVSFSYGILNFHGDVKNSYNSSAIGNNAAMVSLSTFVDRKHHYIANFNFMMGKLSGNEYSHSDITRNLNFETDLSSIGLSLEYRFGHFFPKNSLVRPYVSLGLESINFSAKGDLADENGVTYNYWSDGTIRNYEEPRAGASLIYRDYEFETDLRLRESQEFGLGDYSQHTFSFPAGMGLHFRIDRRAFFSLGVSYHYALTDMMDNVAYEGTSIRGNKGNDSYIFSHLSIHFDLFSEPASQAVDLMVTDVLFDSLFFEDEDGDLALDVKDRCPGTPIGVEVDTLGCPLDGDMDEVPDYLDKELESAPGAWVNENGITVSDDEFLSALQLRNEAMKREDVAAYLVLIMDDYRIGSKTKIPEKFKSLDTDEDGELSFDELLITIDQYFDFQLDLSLDELRQVNELFFSQ
ncbi:MAG: hypothetical protein ABFS38_16235 [Bacteroidota bacterium]